MKEEGPPDYPASHGSSGSKEEYSGAKGKSLRRMISLALVWGRRQGITITYNTPILPQSHRPVQHSLPSPTHHQIHRFLQHRLSLQRIKHSRIFNQIQQFLLLLFIQPKVKYRLQLLLGRSWGFVCGEELLELLLSSCFGAADGFSVGFGSGSLAAAAVRLAGDELVELALRAWCSVLVALLARRVGLCICGRHVEGADGLKGRM